MYIASTKYLKDKRNELIKNGVVYIADIFSPPFRKACEEIRMHPHKKPHKQKWSELKKRNIVEEWEYYL